MYIKKICNTSTGVLFQAQKVKINGAEVRYFVMYDYKDIVWLIAAITLSRGLESIQNLKLLQPIIKIRMLFIILSQIVSSCFLT